MTRGTPASSQIIFLENRVKELEEYNENQRIEINELRFVHALEISAMSAREERKDTRIAELEELLSKINTYYAECIAEREDFRDKLCKFEEDLREYQFLTEELQTMVASSKELFKQNSDIMKSQEQEISELYQAIGLLTTLCPDMEIDIGNPIGMANTIVTEANKYMKLVRYIANDYHELSHDKAYNQRDWWKKLCKNLLEGNDDSQH